MIAAIRSEWAKTWTTRSTWFTLAAIVGLGALFAVLFGYAAATEHARLTAAEQAAYRPAPDFRPLIFVQIAVGYLGLRAFTVEHLTGTMALTLTTVPRRGRVLAAKAVVCAGLTLAAGTLTGLIVVFVNRAVLTSRGVPVNPLAEPGMLRVLAGPGLLLALLGLIGLAVGCLVRSTAGALVVTIVMGVFVPATASLYPEWLARLILGYWPITAGLRLLSLDGDPDLPGPVAGLAVTCAWAAILLAAAYAVFRRRDA
ncbi:ABC transporter permease [Herbidospora yilanensis]|uniref:ABC transporter permease n=1 Tax=Herbidospora yilanensis TaxID=354426 RepID=UPI0007844D37|nr:ABC transporter permease [Herbidospora yilanensis]